MPSPNASYEIVVSSKAYVWFCNNFGYDPKVAGLPVLIGGGKIRLRVFIPSELHAIIQEALILCDGHQSRQCIYEEHARTGDFTKRFFIPTDLLVRWSSLGRELEPVASTAASLANELEEFIAVLRRRHMD